VLAFHKSSLVTNQNSDLIDNHIRFNLAQMSCNRWLGVRLEFYGGAIVLVTALFVVWSRDKIPVGVAGLALSTALQLTSSLGGIVRLTAMLENSLNSVERVNEYSEIESENFIGQSVPFSSWPSHGAIAYDNVTAFYRPYVDMEPVLRDISFVIRGGEKIGIVGRTGAGKTSLVMTLFRILEVSSGQITIDGVNIGSLSLSDLRRVLGLIPQEPIVFEGTVRDNIDPFRKYSDDEVMAALRAAHLYLDLSHKLVVGGKNLSAGQRQQICLARVILRRSKILVLDEATSSLDVVTDNLVLDTIRTVFRESTVLTIAHRLHTIADSDRLLVLDKGRVAEMGSPKELISKRGIFASMVNETGDTTKRFLLSAMGAADRS
jgi:ABC-type multidrug transport system fused ATPase/permease subunit